MGTALELRDVYKSYGDFEAVKGVAMSTRICCVIPLSHSSTYFKYACVVGERNPLHLRALAASRDEAGC